MKQPKAIAIICHEAGAFDLHLGEQFANHLTFDEMLGEVVRLTATGKPRYMETPDQALERRERWRTPAVPADFEEPK